MIPGTDLKPFYATVALARDKLQESFAPFKDQVVEIAALRLSRGVRIQDYLAALAPTPTRELVINTELLRANARIHDKDLREICHELLGKTV